MTDAVAPLLERARSGDREAFAGLVRRYLPSVRAIVRRRSKGRAVPDELVREAFHRAWAGLAGLSARRDFGRWLGGIARYVAVEAARRREPFGGYPLHGTAQSGDVRLLSSHGSRQRCRLVSGQSRFLRLTHPLVKRRQAPPADRMGGNCQAVSEIRLRLPITPVTSQ